MSEATPAKLDGLRNVMRNLRTMSGGDRVQRHLLMCDTYELWEFARRYPDSLTEGERAS